MKVRFVYLISTLAAAFGLVALVLVVLLSSANAASSATPAMIWTDNFDGPPLDKRWSWMKHNPNYWSLTAHPGFLRITTTQQNYNYLIQSAPGGDYQIETRLLFTPTENFQQAGLGIYLDDNNQLSILRGFCGYPFCIGNGIYFEFLDNGDLNSHMLNTTLQGEAYLRITRQGNKYTGSVSENGTDWTVVGTHSVDFNPTKIGLRAGNFLAGAAEIPADFDYFSLVDHSYRVHLPLAIRDE